MAVPPGSSLPASSPRASGTRSGAGWLAAVALAAAAFVPTSAHALFFELRQVEGNTILLLRDGRGGDECAPKVPRQQPFCGFAVGDSDHLRRVLRERPVHEVWLVSGGGVLGEGIGVGRAIREHALATGRLLTVRIPDGQRCVSACTVAFMGGVQRVKNPGATYEVHSGSVYMRLDAKADVWPDDDRTIPAAEAVREAERLLPRIAEAIWQRQLRSIAQLYDYFLDMHVNVPESRRRRTSDPRAIFQLVSTQARPPAFLTPEALAESARDVRTGGVPVLQQRLMAMERESVRAILEAIDRHRDAIGPMADRAYHNVRLMYDTSSIIDTAPLSDGTMREFFYLREYR